MRSIGAGLAAVVAAIALAATLPVGWVAQLVADEDGYVEFTSDLVADSGIRDDVVRIVADDVVRRTGVSGDFAAPVRAAIEAAADAVVESAEFRAAFADVQRESHRALFVSGGAPVAPGDTDQVVIDLAPVAQTIVDSVTSEVPVTIEAPDQLVVAVGGGQARQAVDAVSRTPQQTLLGAGVTALAAGISVLLARRRSTMVAWLGLAGVAVAGAWHLVANTAVPAAVEASGPSGALAAGVQQQLADAALVSFDHWLVVTAVIGAGAVLIGLVARVVGR